MSVVTHLVLGYRRSAAVGKEQPVSAHQVWPEALDVETRLEWEALVHLKLFRFLFFELWCWFLPESYVLAAASFICLTI